LLAGSASGSSRRVIPARAAKIMKVITFRELPGGSGGGGIRRAASLKVKPEGEERERSWINWTPLSDFFAARFRDPIDEIRSACKLRRGSPARCEVPAR